MQIDQSKKIIIVNKTGSKYIEQALFVLKDDKHTDDYESIISDAYKVINRHNSMAELYEIKKRPNLKTRFKQFFKAIWF